MRVGFKWGDSFNPNKKSTQSTLLFERACVLYNLGAHESRSASEEDRSTEAVRSRGEGGDLSRCARAIFLFVVETLAVLCVFLTSCCTAHSSTVSACSAIALEYQHGLRALIVLYPVLLLLC